MKKLIIALALASVSAAAFAAPAPAASAALPHFDDAIYDCDDGDALYLKNGEITFNGYSDGAYKLTDDHSQAGVLIFKNENGTIEMEKGQAKDEIHIRFGKGANANFDETCSKRVEMPRITYNCNDGGIVWYTWAKDHSEAVGEYNNVGNNVGFIVHPVAVHGNDFKAQLTFGPNVIATMLKTGDAIALNDGNGPIICKFAGNK
ncbi:TPA: hypothetical protein ACNEJR_003702 [Escherichia coli]